MKRILLIYFVSVFIISACKSEISDVKIQSYNIKVIYEPKLKDLSVETKIKLNAKRIINGEIHLLFYKSLKISSIEFTENKRNYPVTYKFKADTIVIQVPNELKNNKDLVLQMIYTIPNDSILVNDAVCLFRSSKWIPLQYDVLSKWRIEIQTPPGYRAYSSGDLVDYKSDSINSFYTYSYNYNSGVPLIIVPNDFYSVKEFLINGSIMSMNLRCRDTIEINKLMNDFQKSFHFYSGLFGKYPNKYLRLFEYPDSSANGSFAMSLETFIVVGSNMIAGINNPQIGAFWASHEAVHQWIGVGYVNSFNTRLSWFIEEGLTEYVRLMYIENVYGKDSLNKVIGKLKSDFASMYLNSSYDVPISDNSALIAYIKGPLVFHYVRNQLGDVNWNNFLRTLYNKYYGKVIDYDIFKSELSKYDASRKVIKRMEEMTEMKGILPDN